MKYGALQVMVAALVCASVQAQVNSGSDGHDGAFNPTANTVINMADRPDGIYHYTEVNIPAGVTVTFTPNASNTPVVWLVQSNVLITGTVDLSGQDGQNPGGGGLGGGGAGGYRGGNGGSNATPGQGPGGGSPNWDGANASYGSLGDSLFGVLPGATYGNIWEIPLLGGSGGGGSPNGTGGGGGGGAILVCANETITVEGSIRAIGGNGYIGGGGAGAGSGGAIRLVARRIQGAGELNVGGGTKSGSYPVAYRAGYGRIRFDTYDDLFGGRVTAVFTQGYQPIIIPTPGQGAQLTITSVGGVPVSASPTGTFTTPDAVLSAQQNNPISIVVHCSNIPLNTQVTVNVRPANGATVSATGLNNTGTLSSSTATISINMPRGGGIIYATAATGN